MQEPQRPRPFLYTGMRTCSVCGVPQLTERHDDGTIRYAQHSADTGRHLVQCVASGTIVRPLAPVPEPAAVDTGDELQGELLFVVVVALIELAALALFVGWLLSGWKGHHR